VFTRASAAIDRSVVRFMERRMAPRTPRVHAEDAREKLLAIIERYSAGTLGAPSPFFPEPRHPEIVLSPLGDGPLGTSVIDLRFSSDYVPFHPDARDLYLAATENMTCHARWWTSVAGRGSGRPDAAGASGGRPTIVLVHGWGAGSHWMTERSFGVTYWLRHGYDVVSFVLPFHGLRSATGPLDPIWPTPNPLRMNEGFGHAIYDLRALAMFLRQRGASAVGAMGMSLGGYTTGLWTSIAGPGDVGGIDFAVALIPAVSFARLMWRHGDGTTAQKRASSAGITEDMLAEAFAVHAPTTRPARVPRDRLYVVAGKGDRITPPDHARALATHWGVDVLWFDGGHLAQLGRGEAMRVVRRSLGAHGFSGRAFRS
jgi:pimeloyl-ACP methyl ester carboxylesterase